MNFMVPVTVIMPAFNSHAYIEEALESLVNQTMHDIEIICVNDGSTDDTLEIMEAFARGDQRISIIDKPNTGYGDSINRGLDAAAGRYVTILESDDYLVPDACEKMYEFVKANSLPDFIKADSMKFYGEGKSRFFTNRPVSKNQECYSGVFNPSINPREFFSLPGQPAMYKLEFLNDYGIRLNVSPGASFQDTGIWAQTMFVATTARFLKYPVYMTRRDNPSSSEVSHDKNYCICDEYDFIRRSIDVLDVPHRDISKASCAYFRYDAYIWNLKRINPASAPEFLQRFSADFNKIELAGELDESMFSELQLQDLREIIDDSEAFCWKWYPKRITQLKRQLVKEQLKNEEKAQRLASSTSWKIGRAITSVPRAAKKQFRKDGK